MMTKKPTKVKKEKELSFYAIKMARYYEEEWNKLFKAQDKFVQKLILHEPEARRSRQFAKDVIKAAQVRDYEDDNQQY